MPAQETQTPPETPSGAPESAIIRAPWLEPEQRATGADRLPPDHENVPSPEAAVRVKAVSAAIDSTAVTIPQSGGTPPKRRGRPRKPAAGDGQVSKQRTKRERMRGTLSEILDVDGAAEALGISSRLVLRLLRSGELPGKKVGREWRILRSAILSWLKAPEGGEPSWLKGAIESGRATVEKKG